MKVEAAIAVEAGKPLEIGEIELDGPKEGECLVRLAATGVCHTDAFTLSGDDPEGLFPAILGHEGAGVIEEVGPGVRSLAVGDHVIPLYTPECRECKFCLSGKTNLCQAIRETQGQGVMPDGTSRMTWRGQKLYHYMGTSTFAKATVVPEIALAKVRKDAPLDKVCLLGCGVTTGIGAVLNTCIDTNPKKFELAMQFGATECVNPKEVGDIEGHIIDATDGGVDYSFECIGNVETMGMALRIAHKGWGESIIIGVAGAGQEIHARPFLLVTGRVWRGTAFGGTKGRTQVPGLVDRYMNGRVKLDEMVSRTLPLEDINQAFDLMHEGEVIRSVIRYDL